MLCFKLDKNVCIGIVFGGEESTGEQWTMARIRLKEMKGQKKEPDEKTTCACTYIS